jgi:hypothetical protein
LFLTRALAQDDWGDESPEEYEANRYLQEFRAFVADPENPPLDFEEFTAISKYRNMAYVEVNDLLRTGEGNEKTQDLVRLMKRGVSKLPKFRGVTWRGASFEDFPELYTFYTKVGATVFDPAFVSTSVDRRVAESFITDNGEKNLVLFAIKGYSGRVLKGIGGSGIDQAEQEVLFPAATRFRIVGVKMIVVDYPDYGLENTPVKLVKMVQLPGQDEILPETGEELKVRMGE